MLVFVLHPLLRADTVEARDYQVRLAQVAAEHAALIVLPTGLGKTMIAVLAAVQFLEKDAARRILILAPTKPLVEQHARVFRECLADVTVAAFTGDTGPAERDAAWEKSRVIVCTPQVVENDLVRGARDLRDVSYLVFDEAHRAGGNYPYVFIARRYRAAGGTAALGLTASPGSDLAKIQAVLHHLGLRRIEVRTDHDEDVKPFIHPIATQWLRVKPTVSLLRGVQLLTRCYVRAVGQLRRLGFLPGIQGIPNRKDLLELGQRIRMEAAGGRGRRSVYEAASVQARALKIQHALELTETQGLSILSGFLSRVQAEAEQAGGTRAARDFAKEPEFAEVLTLSRSSQEPHPKAPKVIELVRDQLAAGARRVLVFANYRETAELIVSGLSAIPECRAHRFVGHGTSSGERGLTKKAQQAIVERFRSGDLNVLVATSVAEEGLDLPETDVVVLYEPVPSGIRMIQRRGRTGRRGQGKMFVLITEGTRDEHYHWAALRREKRMHEELVFLQKSNLRQIQLSPEEPSPQVVPLPTQMVEVVVDVRESASAVPKRLLERGARIKTSPLPVGDYSVGGRILIERKTTNDFVSSLRDGRLFDQARRLAEATPHPMLVVEGDVAEIQAHVPLNTFLGAIASLALDHRVTTVQLPDASATAEFLLALMRRERNNADPGRAALRFQKRKSSAAEELRFIVEGLPAIGPVIAQRLLSKFGTLADLFQAEADMLENVEGVGPERAKTLHEVLRRPYREAELTSLVAEPAGVSVASLEGRDGAARGAGPQLAPVA